MELLLNRIKSEFSLARLLYYCSLAPEEEWLIYKNELKFTELFEDEWIGVEAEMLRNSFRICFGILDKIAYAICDLFQLALPKEQIPPFESFWRSKWEKLKNI